MERSVGDILKDGLDHSREILRSEVRLARAEIREEALQAMSGGIFAAVAALFAVFGINFLLWTAVWALAPEMPDWLSALIVSAAVLILAGICAVVAMKKFRSLRPVPERTVETVEENLEWAKNRAR